VKIQNKKIKIAIAQMCSTLSVEKNLDSILNSIAHASQKKAQLICFPENCLLMGLEKNSLLESKEKIEKHALPIIQKQAKKNSIAVLLGGVSIYQPKKKKFYNRIFFYSDQGRLCATYDKIHLFDTLVTGDAPYRESRTVLPGKKTVVFPWKNTKIGLSICYDLRFPELYRNLAQKGAELIFVPAAFTVPTGKAHWNILTRARAIENLCYIIAPAQSGKHESKRKTYGHSQVIHPWGEVAHELKHKPGIFFVEIDLNFLRKTRKTFPALQHRKLDCQ